MASLLFHGCDDNNWKTFPGPDNEISVDTPGVLLTTILIIINARVVKLQSFSTGADSYGRRTKLGQALFQRLCVFFLHSHHSLEFHHITTVLFGTVAVSFLCVSHGAILLDYKQTGCFSIECRKSKPK